MSRYFSTKYQKLTPYTPGEQPKGQTFIKLNTNESPFPPSERAVKGAEEAAKRLQLYSDPECRALTEKVAKLLNVEYENVLMTNGSDEILNFAFMAYCDAEHPAAFADITYGFYPVFAELNGIPYQTVPLKEDFSIDIRDYFGLGKTIFIANPNAPTGLALSRDEIEQIIKNNPDTVVVIDEAYVDFGAESCVPLIKKYDNLLVTQTFSKSRSMAGARLGFGVASRALIADLNTVKFSTNPYNVNSMTMAAGLGMLADEEQTVKNCRTIMENRAFASEELKKLGFVMTESKTNFMFARHSEISGEELYLKLREKGILVRHFKAERIADYNRITVGTHEQMQALIDACRAILEEES